MLAKVDPSISHDLETLIIHFRQYTIDTSLERPLRIQDEAQCQISLDLSLAADVYAPRPFADVESDGSDPLANMSRAAEALTLVDEPPLVHLGYLELRPGNFSNPLHHIVRLNTLATQVYDGPLTVRLLLNEWSIGADPESYAYEDPYGESNQPTPILRQHIAETTAQTTGPARSQVPPMVVASKPTAPPIIEIAGSSRSEYSWRVSEFENQSQPGRPIVPQMASQTTSTDAPDLSQEALTSTQVLPGPFGGRQAGKKKPIKKRMGGF